MTEFFGIIPTNDRSSRSQIYSNYVFLKNLQNSQENTYVGVSF